LIEINMFPNPQPCSTHGFFGRMVMRIVSTAAFTAMSVMVVGCGAPGNAPTSALSQVGNKADVLLTLDGVHHLCVVALSQEEQGSSIGCSDIVSFLKDELRVPIGATIALRTTPETGKADSASVRETLENAGYRFVGDR
jgi:hypothetical protein